MIVAVGVSLLQVGVLMAAVLTFTVAMYGLAEILASRIPTQEECVGLTPVVAILPWFLAGSLFRIAALPAWLADIADERPPGGQQGRRGAPWVDVFGVGG